MKNAMTFLVLIGITFAVPFLAQAQDIEDLPNPFEDLPPRIPSPVIPSPVATPAPTPVVPRVVVVIPPPSAPATPAPTPAPNITFANIEISEISRKTGGAWYSLDVVKATGSTTLESLQYRVTAARVHIHEVSLVFVDGTRQNVDVDPNFQGPLNLGAEAASSRLRQFGEISAIQLRLESYGAGGALGVTVASQNTMRFKLRDGGGDIHSQNDAAVNAPTGNCASGLTIASSLAALDNAMNDANYRANYGGSGELSAALQKVKTYGQQMLNLATTAAALRGTTEEIFELASNYAYKASYNAARGTLPYNVYTTIQDVFYKAAPTSIEMAMKCSEWDYFTVLAEGANYLYKANYNAARGTAAYNAYVLSAQKIYAAAPAAFARYFAKSDHGTLQAYVADLEYKQTFNSTRGAIDYNAFGAVKQKAALMAQQALRSYIRQVPASYRRSLVDDYTYKMTYNTARGTFMYGFYAAMRTIANGPIVEALCATSQASIVSTAM